MPLFELEDGPDRKFYRIELDGTRVGLHWGRLGGGGTHESLQFETRGEARAEYERQIARRRERGYRELEAGALPREEPGGASAASIAAHDRAMAELVERGFELEQLGHEARATPRKQLVLRPNRALEDAVAEDPFDGSAWMVLEDWLLEVEDPRAALVRVEQIGGDVSEAYAALAVQLLGQRHVALAKAIPDVTWRAGYLLAACFAPRSHHRELLAALVASPAAALLRTFEMQVLIRTDLAPMLEQLCTARCARSLRELTIVPLLPMGETTLDGEAVARLKLERLAIKHVPLAVKYAESLVSLRRLELLPETEVDVITRPFPELRTLVIDVSPIELRETGRSALRLEDLRPLLAGSAAPKLENLAIANARPDTIQLVVEELATSALLSRLRTLDLGGRQIEGASLGAPFAHLERVRLPER